MESMEKAFRYLSVLPEHPKEFFKRAAQLIEPRLDRLFRKPAAYQAVSWSRGIQDLDARFGRVVDILDEPALSDVEEQVRQRLENNYYTAPFSLSYNADLSLARCCYLACRLLEPSVVVETGVAYGVTSAFVLRALEENGRGVLCSVDLPPPGREVNKFVGLAIPEKLKDRWHLNYGFSRSVLPELLRKVRTVDIFVQDGSHTYRNMRWEFETLWPKIPTGGIIIADDIQSNRAFSELQQRDLSFQQIIQEAEKQALFGIAIK